ncbi:hypothetical protein, partial [Escherichia coli]|uniref:hypothetical protein n=1 Tax=Escherichia coli TaxID=562 RepID=UPI00228224E7
HTGPPHLWQLSNNSKLTHLWNGSPVGPLTCGGNQSVSQSVCGLAHRRSPVNKNFDKKLVFV